MKQHCIKYDPKDPNWQKALADKRAVDKEWGFFRADGELIAEIEWEVNEEGKHPYLRKEVE